MPRKACLTENEIFEVVKDTDCFTDSGDLKSRSDPVWADICRSLKDKIKIINLYLYVKQNRNNIRSRLEDYKGIATVQDTEHSLSFRSCNTSNTSNTKQDESIESIHSDNKPVCVKNDKECSTILYSITIDAETWQRIAPKTVVYKEHGRYGSRRKYSILQRGWTDVISKLCWSKTKIPCVYTFKRAKVYDSANGAYITIFGRCKDCSAYFSAHSIKKPEVGNDVKLFVKTVDTRGVPHEKKRALKGTERAVVQKDLLHKKAIVWRREMTKEMEYGDPESSHLYTTDVLRKARQEGKDKELGVHKVQNVNESISHLKYDVQYAGVIREIGLDKFYCMYWSPLQIDIYKDIVKSNSPISIDATGSLVQKIVRKNQRSGAIFLYQAVAPGISGIVPLFQMLSEKHNANIIQYWMSEWLRCGGKIPHEVITDFSFALLNAVARAFNSCSLAQYIKTCVKYLNHEGVAMPICRIRLDIAHIIKMITKWQCFRGKAPRIKDFYLRCVGFLTTVESKDEFEDILHSILIVALSECDDKDTECANRQEFLLKIIRNFTMEEKEKDEESDSNDNHPLNEIDAAIENDNLSHFNKLYDSAKDFAAKTHSGERPNAYYCPDFVTPFMRFATYYVLWTNVMVQKTETKYLVASSARSEAYFNDIKNITLSDESKSIRADKFIIKHVRSIDSICKIERAALDNRAYMKKNDCMETDELKQNIHQIIDEADTINLEPYSDAEENWRGLNPRKKLKEEATTADIPRKRGKYLTACPDITFIHNRPLRKKKGACIQNGSLLPPIKIGTTKLQALSTCPFDSLMELLTTGYVDSVVYKQTVDEKYKDLIFFQIMLNYATNGVSNAFYFERLSYLLTLFDADKSILDCACNISTFIGKALIEAPSIREKNTCARCNYEEIKNIPIAEINTKPILTYGLHNGLQKSMDMFLHKEILCKNCGNKIFCEINPEAHLLIDVEHAYHSTLLAQMEYSNSPKDVPLTEVPTHLYIKKDKYQLIGLITYNGSAKQQALGHYITYCHRLTDAGLWEQYDDLKNKYMSLQPTTATHTHVIPNVIAYIKLDTQ